MSVEVTILSAFDAIPTEIWKQILRIATLPSPQSKTSASGVYGWKPRGGPDASSLTTKLAIALTSKYFWIAGSEFLYETLVLRKASQAQGLLDRISEDDQRQIGLDIASKVHTLILRPTYLEGDLGTYETTCTRLIALCKNISSMKFCSPVQFRPWTRSRSTASASSIPNPSILQKQASSVMTLLSNILTADRTIPLLELDVHADFRVTLPGGVAFTDVLKGLAPSLRTLRLVGPFGRKNEGATLSFPNLTHLAVMRLPCMKNNTSSIFHSWTFDSITHFYVDSYMNDGMIQSFWSTPRPNIIFLHLGESLLVARVVTSATPNLEVLEFASALIRGDIWRSQVESYELPKKLKHVVVQTYSTVEFDDTHNIFNARLDPRFAEIIGDLASSLQPFINPRLPSLESFTLRVNLGHRDAAGGGQEEAFRKISDAFGPGVIVLDTSSETETI